jgi:hypothetical protein
MIKYFTIDRPGYSKTCKKHIGHFPFIIFHFPFVLERDGSPLLKQWKMKNDKWKMTNKSLNQPSDLFPPALPYGSSLERRRGIGSVARRLG